jgi:hypothetical protein
LIFSLVCQKKSEILLPSVTELQDQWYVGLLYEVCNNI